MTDGMLSIPKEGHKRQLSFHHLFFVSFGGGGGGLGKSPEAPFLGQLCRENTKIEGEANAPAIVQPQPSLSSQHHGQRQASLLSPTRTADL